MILIFFLKIHKKEKSMELKIQYKQQLEKSVHFFKFLSAVKRGINDNYIGWK